MGTKRFEQLKQQAIITLYELDMLSGSGIIHMKNAHRGYIVSRLRYLDGEGHTVRWNWRNSNIPYTLDGLEQALTEANIWITKIKLRGR